MSVFNDKHEKDSFSAKNIFMFKKNDGGLLAVLGNAASSCF